jgi:hypothetical protein
VGRAACSSSGVALGTVASGPRRCAAGGWVLAGADALSGTSSGGSERLLIACSSGDAGGFTVAAGGVSSSPNRPGACSRTRSSQWVGGASAGRGESVECGG